MYLRSNANTPYYHTIIVKTPGGSVEYKVPTIKIRNYDIETLLEKRLFFLIPFYFFNFEIKSMDSKPADIALARSGLEKFLVLCKACLNQAVEDGLNESNPCDKITLPKDSFIVKKKRQKLILDDDELIIFKEACLK